MAEHDDWTAADDARVRAALTALRSDVESAPLPDVRFVKARGMARRRQRLLTWTAAAAAAAVVVVVGTVGYSEFGRDASGPLVPATRGGTTSAAPSPTTTEPPNDTIMLPGVLPPGAEWQRTLGLAGEPTVQDQPAYEGNLCQPPESGDRRETERVVADATRPDDTFLGVQTRYTYSTAEDAVAGADGLAQGIAKCFAPVNPGPVDTLELYPNVSARTWSYTKDGDTGWLIVVHAQKDVSYLEVGAGTAAGAAATPADVKRLAVAASARLDRYGSAAATTAPSSTTTGTSSGPKATVEKMTIYGPDPVPSASLFVPPSQWKDPRLAKGSATTSGSDTNEGSTAIVTCENADQQAGVAGRVGVVGIRMDGGLNAYLGYQRVRVFDDVKADALVAADLARMDDLVMKGCQLGKTHTAAVAGPTQGTYLLTNGSGDQTLRQWVGITPMRTAGGVATITFYSAKGIPTYEGTDAQGFALLDRLLALASKR